ncbi:ribosome hibernation-promoting factor, HPF/YfiA family [Microvirga sp. Mcv34]|uniref:ribosome hibernation-promoting factor, HPF/YfiA family n=1 Tax=Microvirga sp. Mcv34 TaxID=2926016 RepID=UPI0021C6C1B1|nr:ribosome-associated translation inhibitor RaiA [Microvirga sp. Mcv34]
MTQNAISAPIKINGSNVNLGEALPHKVQDQLLHVAKTYFRQLHHGTVGFTRDGHSYSCTINIQVSNLRMIVAEASAGDCHQAFDQALGKVDKQLRRRKRRMIDASRG